jgi:flagella basal body P-ring formation protein FlgA
MLKNLTFAKPGARANLIGRIGIFWLCALSTGVSLRASESNSLPVPAITIYPGDAIKDSWLVDREFASTSSARGNVVVSRDLIVGKVARRTLLPGTPIPLNAVSDPKIVANGTKVRIVFEEGGLTIVTYGAALQDGSLGELISLRNLETGITISGIVQSDGSVRLSGG